VQTKKGILVPALSPALIKNLVKSNFFPIEKFQIKLTGNLNLVGGKFSTRKKNPTAEAWLSQMY
jgi:hypothetical protein